MTRFPDTIYRHWQTPFQGHSLYRDAHLHIVVNPHLDMDEAVTILQTANDTQTRIALHPAIAQRLRNNHVLHHTPPPLTEAQFRKALGEIGIVMHGADHLFYVPDSTREKWLQEPENHNIRQLHHDDAMRFAELEYHTSDQELDQAQVALDDWAVFGVLNSNHALLAAASLYHWDHTNTIVDVGILTQATARGQGHATSLLR